MDTEPPKKTPNGCLLPILIAVGVIILIKVAPNLVAGAGILYMVGVFVFLFCYFIWEHIKGDNISDVGNNTVKFIVSAAKIIAVILVIGFFTRGCSSSNEPDYLPESQMYPSRR